MVTRAWGPVLAWARGPVTRAAVARAVGRSPSWQTNLETGRRGASASAVVEVLEALRAMPDSTAAQVGLTLDELAALARLVAAWTPPPAPTWSSVEAWRDVALGRELDAQLLALRGQT